MSAYNPDTHLSIQRNLLVDDDYNELDSEHDSTSTFLPQISKKKKVLDLDAIKQELSTRPDLEQELGCSLVSPKMRVASIQRDLVETPYHVVEQLEQVNFIKKIKNDLPHEVIKRFYGELRYQHVSQFSAVYKQGEAATKFFIILEGTVVVLKSKDKLVGYETVSEEQKEHGHGESENPVSHIKSRYMSQMHIKTLYSGQSFGEVSLKLEVSRTSTVVAAVDTHLLWVDGHAYRSLLDPYFSQLIDQKMCFFRNHSLFRTIEAAQIMGILLELHKHTFPAGAVIYDEDDPPTHLYFIIAGQIELSKRLPLPLWNEHRANLRSQSLVIASLQAGQMFGAVDVLLKQPRFLRARVISPKLLVYRISKNKFFDNLGNFQVFEEMKRNSQTISHFYRTQYQKQVNEILEEKDEVMIQLSKSVNGQVLTGQILNNRVIQYSEGKNLKVFQSHVDDVPLKRDVLQKVYSNSIQNYLGKIISKRSLHASDSIRSLHQKPEQQQAEGTTSVKPVVQSVGSLPRIERENIVLSIMRQNALKSKNPLREQRKIQQSFELAANKALKRKQLPHKHTLSPSQQQLILMKALKLDEIAKDKKRSKNIKNSDLISFKSLL